MIIDHTRTVLSLDEDARRGFVAFLWENDNINGGMGVGRREELVHMNRLPSKGGNPLGVSFERVTDGFTRLGIPDSDLVSFILEQRDITERNGANIAHMAIMPTRCKFAFSCLPFYTQNPALVARECVRWCLCVEIPETGGGIAGASGKHATCRGERRTKDRRGMAYWWVEYIRK